MKRKLGIISAGLITALLLSPMLLYWWGLSNVETKPVPSTLKLSSAQELEIWSKEKETGVPRVESITPYAYIKLMFCSSEGEDVITTCLSKHPGLRISSLAIRRQIGAQMDGKRSGVWHITWAAYTVWVTQTWNIHQILATYHDAYSL